MQEEKLYRGHEEILGVIDMFTLLIMVMVSQNYIFVNTPTPVLLPGKSHGRRSLVGCSPWGR